MPEEICFLNEDYLRIQIRKNLIKNSRKHKVRITVNETVRASSVAGKLSAITVGKCEIEIPREFDELISKIKGKSKKEIEHELLVQYGFRKLDKKQTEEEGKEGGGVVVADMAIITSRIASLFCETLIDTFRAVAIGGNNNGTFTVLEVIAILNGVKDKLNNGGKDDNKEKHSSEEAGKIIKG